VLEIIEKCRETKSTEVKSDLMWSEWNKVKWSEWSKWSGMRRSEVQYWEGGGRWIFMEKVYRSSKWQEVKDWGESVRELMIVKKKIKETVHSTLAWVFLPFVHVVFEFAFFVLLLVLSCLVCNCCWLAVCIVAVILCVFSVLCVHCCFFFNFRCRTAG
jgi:hypothetical protein